MSEPALKLGRGLNNVLRIAHVLGGHRQTHELAAAMGAVSVPRRVTLRSALLLR
jgi:hypothetical protein